MAVLDKIDMQDVAAMSGDDLWLKNAAAKRMWQWIWAHRDESAVKVGPFELSWNNRYVRAVCIAVLGPCPLEVCR